MTMNVDTAMLRRMVEFRRSIHRHPELGYKEAQTAALVKQELERLGISYKEGVAVTGIRAEIVGRQKCPCPRSGIALRADMDALPIAETTGLAFASSVKGVMHACGHDGHVAMLLGAASLLRDGNFPGRVILLFQPAEESGNGAARMVAENALENVKMIFGGHIDTHIPVGSFTVDSGLICAYADPFTIRIHGRGGHAARPHEAVDSVVLASTLIMSMQTLVSRQINPSHAAVVTVGRIQAGTVHNAIAEHAILEGTIRSAHPESRKCIQLGLQRLIQGIRDMSNAEIEIEYFEGLPAVINDRQATSIARRAAVDIIGEKQVGCQAAPSLGGEDFAFYLQQVPGCLVRFGAQVSGDRVGPAHSGRYDFDEAVLGYGAAWLERVARISLDHLCLSKP